MLELGQIQSTILREYYRKDSPPFECFLFLRFEKAESGRAFIKRLLPSVTSCADVDKGVEHVINIGLTYPAVDMFGYGGAAHALNQTDHEATGAIEAFKCGMETRAVSILGDINESDPRNWERVYRGGRIHAVVWVTAHREELLRKGMAKVEDAIAKAPTVELLHVQEATGFTGEYAGTEHFGYADGIAQPSVLGSDIPDHPGDGTPRKRRGWDRLQPGEFVLGQIDESGQNQFRSPFFVNGSFMVLRKLEQHVVRFREYVEEVAQRNGASPELIASKMVGRWPSGAPLVLSPDEDDPKLGANEQKNNDFRYADDPEGLRCPLGAHIRRNNPREDPSGPGAVQTRLHRIIRRSTPYGPRLPDGAPDDGKERGVMFAVINADIARQFEFVQLNWVNSVLSSTVLTLPADRDPIIGQQLRSRSAGKFLIPSSHRKKAPTIAWGLPTFVTTKGGAYFLLPSLDALWDIAHGKTYEDDAGCDGDEPQPQPDPLPEAEERQGPSPCDKLPRPEPSPSDANAPAAEPAPADANASPPADATAPAPALEKRLPSNTSSKDGTSS